MRIEDLNNAVAEAKRFIEKAALIPPRSDPRNPWTQPGQASAAVKRASLDLTRALAKTRKS